MGYREREYERLHDLDIELRELASSRVDDDVEVFIEREGLRPPAPAARAASSVPTTSQLNAQRTKDWERWLGGHLAAERNHMLNIIAAALEEFERRTADRAPTHEAIGEAMVEYVGKKTGELRKQIQQLRTEIQQLRDVPKSGEILAPLPSSSTIRKIRIGT